MPGTATYPAVSIIMPTYNRASSILETIESVRSQTFENWELIIIDDGSDDDTESIVARANDERIRFYKAGRSGVISKMRKMGIEKASGKLIAFIDSDDLWDVTKLDKQVSALEQNTTAGFCITGGYNFRQAGTPVDFFYKQREGIKSGNLFNSFFRSELSGYLQALMFRKECMNTAASFKETDNDVDFILRLARNFEGIILYKPLLFRRLHDTNYSNTNWKKNYSKGIAVINSYKNEMEPQIVKDAFFKLYINFGEDCLKNGQSKEAAKNFFRAWKNKPLNIIPIKKTGKLLLQYLKK